MTKKLATADVSSFTPMSAQDAYDRSLRIDSSNMWYKDDMTSSIPQPQIITESYEQYIQHIADLNMSAKAKYELLYIVNSILSHFVDQAFNVQTDQISLRSVANSSSPAPCEDGIGDQLDSVAAMALSEPVERGSSAQGSSEP